MAVDPTRQHQLTPRVDLSLGSCEATADRRDGFASDGDVGFKTIGRGGDAPFPDDQVVGGLGHDNLQAVSRCRRPLELRRALAPGA